MVKTERLIIELYIFISWTFLHQKSLKKIISEFKKVKIHKI